MSRQQTIIELLNANDAWALHAKGTTNHCPMALSALYLMGADSRRMREFFHMWETNYAIPAEQSANQIDASNYLQQTGKRENFHALKHFLTQKIVENGLQHTLQDVFSELPFGPGSGAFHALIRMAYGIEMGHNGEIAAGLAACIVGNFSILLKPPANTAMPDTAQSLQHISAALQGCVFAGDFIQARLRAVAADAIFIRTVPAPPQRPDLLNDIAAVAIQLYAQTRNFTVLHMVTGTHAARVLLSVLPPVLHEQFLSEFWLACCAAYVSVGAPSMSLVPVANPAPDTPAWSQLFRVARASNDDHVIKLVYSCYCEKEYVASPYYHSVAVHAVKLSQSK